MSFFISDAVAATGAPAQGSPMSLILMLVVFGLIFYVTKVAETGYIAIALNDTTEVVIKRDFVAAVLPKGTMKAL